METKLLTIVRRRRFYGQRPVWEIFRDDMGEPVVAASPAAARRIIAGHVGEVYYLSYAEYAAPDWGYRTPSGRVHRVR